jgi:signal recognition particle receptor subunit beta
LFLVILLKTEKAMVETKTRQKAHELIDSVEDEAILEIVVALLKRELEREYTANDYRKSAVINGNRILAKSLRNYEG